MTVPGGRGAARRTAAIVAGLTAVFFAADAVLNWVLAVHRHHQLVTFDRIGKADFLAGRIAAPKNTVVGPDYQPLGFDVPGPQHQLGEFFGQVAVETLAFLAIVLVVAVLMRRGRVLGSLLAVGAAVVSIAADGGVLSRLTVPITTTSPYSEAPNGYQTPFAGAPASARAAWIRYTHLSIYFGTPLWWRCVVAAAVLSLLLGAVVLMRRRDGLRVPVAERRRTYVVVSIALVVFGFVGMVGSPDFIWGAPDTYAFGLLTSTLLLGLALAIGASSIEGRRGLAASVALATVVAAVEFISWWATHNPGGASQVYGFIDMGSDPPLIGTRVLWAALIAAAPTAWLVGEALRRGHSVRFTRNPKLA